MLELLADRAIFGLDGTEKAELRELEQQFPELASDQSFERAAAAYSISTVGTVEQMPAALRSKLESDAANMFASFDKAEDPVVASRAKDPAPVVAVEFEKPGFSLSQWLGWGVAFAAVALLAVNVWMTRFQGSTQIAGTSPSPVPTAAQEPTTAERMQAFLASAPDVVKSDWSSPAEDGSVGGEVVWSDAKQEGYMTFKGLDRNDVTKEQYQLWIFDETQDEATPVDGGVFDVGSDGEVTIPIDAKLAVTNPKMFAVTVEKPGGVVVSKREKIVALAKV